MDNENNMHSSLYEVVPIDFPQGEDYIFDIELIPMSITGICHLIGLFNALTMAFWSLFIPRLGMTLSSSCIEFV